MQMVTMNKLIIFGIFVDIIAALLWLAILFFYLLTDYELSKSTIIIAIVITIIYFMTNVIKLTEEYK